MYEVEIDRMDLKQIAESGQCFRWKQVKEGTYSIIAFERYLEVTQNGSTFTFSCDEEEFNSVWYDYFDLGTDYGEVIRDIDQSDEYLKNAVGFGSGIRILKQDLWEIIISFIISQNNNLPRIKGIIEKLCKKFGRKNSSGGREWYGFARADSLYEGGMEGLRDIGLGYRDKYIYGAAVGIIRKNISLDRLISLNYQEAQTALKEIYGIGEKVADCICLYGLHQIEAFPADTHIFKLFAQYYPKGFPYGRYKGKLGIIQQYLFYHDLKSNSV